MIIDKILADLQREYGLSVLGQGFHIALVEPDDAQIPLHGSLKPGEAPAVSRLPFHQQPDHGFKDPVQLEFSVGTRQNPEEHLAEALLIVRQESRAQGQFLRQNPVPHAREQDLLHERIKLRKKRRVGTQVPEHFRIEEGAPEARFKK